MTFILNTEITKFRHKVYLNSLSLCSLFLKNLLNDNRKGV